MQENSFLDLMYKLQALFVKAGSYVSAGKRLLYSGIIYSCFYLQKAYDKLTEPPAHRRSVHR